MLIYYSKISYWVIVIILILLFQAIIFFRLVDKDYSIAELVLYD